MSIRISKHRISASGDDANGLLIAMADDARLLEWAKNNIGSEGFRRMVREAIAARGLTATPGHEQEAK